MKTYQRRKFVIIFGIIAMAIIFLLRLFYLQVVDNRWIEEAKIIVESRESVSPPRGIITDRNKKVLVDNIIAYHLKIYPVDFLRNQDRFDTLSFCRLLQITETEFSEKMTKVLGSEDPYLITTSLNKLSFEKNKVALEAIPGLYFKELSNSILVSVKASRFKQSDTLALAQLLEIKPEFLIKKLKQAWRQPILMNNKRMFMPMIPISDFKKIAEQLYRFSGFFVEPVLQRHYPAGNAAQVLGYLAEVNHSDLEQDRYYRLSDMMGMTGLEQTYEKELRGEKGVLSYLKNAYSAKVKIIERDQDEIAIPGENLEITLDSDLQAYGELLMKNKTGSIVALDPKTGEILAMVSAGGYNPNDLTGREFSKNYAKLLLNDAQTPLYNKAIKAIYRPGSIFKLVQALIGLQEKVITPHTGIPCNTGLIGCHIHPWANNIQQAIQYSCNPYFYTVFKKLIQRGNNSVFKEAATHLPTWSNYVQSFGLGTALSIDIGGTFKGMVPDKPYYDRLYGASRWAFSTIYSLSIGEGELQVTPLQMANFTAIIANRGYFYTPHFLRGKNGETGKKPEYSHKHFTLVDSVYFEPVIEGMQNVVSQGTGRNALVKNITVAGKTGTVQTQSLKAQKQNLNPHLRDHGVFIAFAPVEDPKIALAVYVEYSGFGATFAASITGLMIEKYLKGEIENKKKEAYYKNAVIKKNEPIFWEE